MAIWPQANTEHVFLARCKHLNIASTGERSHQKTLRQQTKSLPISCAPGQRYAKWAVLSPLPVIYLHFDSNKMHAVAVAKRGGENFVDPCTYKSPNEAEDSAELSLLLWPATATKQFIEKWTQSA
ncbi:uncharacterized protein LOC120446415 [Drosophila santomea]|uniref:uncharacterized protein LOC120446415 n=1 Tax=Drosophila santomea TaxID=129105 RepID=UPI001954A5CD|nr:uncharacterized protein LOC120446415 [Drosophila santomea]